MYKYYINVLPQRKKDSIKKTFFFKMERFFSTSLNLFFLTFPFPSSFFFETRTCILSKSKKKLLYLITECNFFPFSFITHVVLDHHFFSLLILFFGAGTSFVPILIGVTLESPVRIHTECFPHEIFGYRKG